MTTLAMIVFTACSLVTSVGVIALLLHLWERARHGHEGSQFLLFGLVLTLLLVGFGWSADVLWPAP